MNYNKNRLQFVHCDTLFATSDEAKAYVIGQLDEIDRPALYAEPMILKYGNVNSPNILFAVGSVGDGSTISTKNKTFFIDSAKMEADIKELFENKDATAEEVAKLQGLVSNIIISCGLKADGTYSVYTDDVILNNASSLHMADKMLSVYIQKLENKSVLNTVNGETLSLGLTKADSGMTLTGEVIIAPNKVVDSNVLPNIILHESNGIFTNVDLNYVAQDAQLKLAVNGNIKTLQLPLETHIIKGVYDEKIESLVLTFNREIELKDEKDEPVISNKLIVDLGKLINEWTVLGENSNTPIVLTRTQVSTNELLANADNERELKSWQDILQADVRVASTAQVPNNILKKDATGRFLYVDGIASNIKCYKDGNKITVQEALDKVETKISQSVGNMIFKRSDGIFANSELSYIANENSLLFKTSTKEGGEKETKIKLNSISFIEHVDYDPVDEVIIITYIDAEGKSKDIRIPVRGLIDEWVVDNTNNTVTLVKTKSIGVGQDTLTANVNIASGTQDNILEVRGHALYVNGTAENIRFSGTSTVFEEIINEQNRAKGAETAITNALTTESTRAKDAEGLILTKLHEEVDRATASDISINTKVTSNTENITTEIARAKAEEGRIETKVNNETIRATAKETELEGKINSNTSAIATEVTRATTNETTISNNLTTEIARAKAEEGRIETKLDGEIISTDTNIKKLTIDVKTVTDNLATEVTRAKESEVVLTSAINEEILRAKADESALLATLTNVITDETNRAKTAEVSLSTEFNAGITAEMNRAKIAEIAIDTKADGNNNAIVAEVERAKIAEKLISDKTDNNTITINAEVVRATTEESLLRQTISDVKAENSFITTNSGNIEFVKTTGATGSVLTGSVIVATNVDHNLINSDGQALYANVSLDYDTVSNTLKFKASDGTDKDIKLSAGSIIDAITYDALTEEIVIMYTDANGVHHETRFSARTLFNEWVVADTNPGAVKLVKLINTGSTPDVLSAEVIISSLVSGNLLQNIGGSLYVSNQAKDIILANGDSVETGIKNINIALTKEINDRIDGDTHLQIQINELSGKTKDYDSAIKSLQDKDVVHDTQITDLNRRVDDIKANDAQQDVKILAIEKENILIKEEQKLIKEDIDNIKAKDIDQDAAILEAQVDIDNLELKTNISAIETLSVKMEYNATINSSNIKANTKISNDALNLIKINKSGDDITDGGNGLLFDGSIDYGTF